MHTEPYVLFVSGRIAELVAVHTVADRYQLLIWDDKPLGVVRDIKEADVNIDWSTIPTNLRTAHRRVVNRMLNGADLEVRDVKDFFAGLTKAASLKTVTTVEGYEKALMVSSRMGKFPLGDCVEEQVNVNYEDRYGRDLSPPMEPPSLAEALAAVPDDPAWAQTASQAIYDYLAAPAEPGGAPFESVAMLALPNSPTVGELHQFRALYVEMEGEMGPEAQRRFEALLERAEKREPDTHYPLGAVDPAFAMPAKQSGFEKKLLKEVFREEDAWLAAHEKVRNDEVRKAEIESGPYSIEAKLRFLNARLLDLPKGTPGRHKKIADIHHQIRRLSKKLPKDKTDPMVSSLSERLERILTPATA